MDIFIEKLKTIRKGNILVVGHSNTVDDIVNRLSQRTEIAADLKDNEYDNLFILKRKGRGYLYKNEKYGNKSSD